MITFAVHSVQQPHLHGQAKSCLGICVYLQAVLPASLHYTQLTTAQCQVNYSSEAGIASIISAATGRYRTLTSSRLVINLRTQPVGAGMHPK